MKTLSIQQGIFSEIKKQIPNNKNIADALTEILSISKAATYKRLNGDTALTLDDIKMLSQHFRFSVDNYLFENVEMVNIDLHKFEKKVNSFEHSFNPLLEHLSNTQNNCITYISNTVPIMHFFLFEELINFKVFCWGKSIWKLNNLKNVKYHNRIIVGKLSYFLGLRVQRNDRGLFLDQ